MQRVDTPSAITTKPANEPVGTPGYFTKGDPALSVPATVPGQDWFNSVQEELIAILTAAGVVPDKADHGQIIAALEQLYWSSRNDGEGSGLDADLLDGYHADMMSRWVMNTAIGGTGAEDGANTWAKIVTLTPSNNDFDYLNLSIEISNNLKLNGTTCTLSIYTGQQTTGLDNAYSFISIENLTGDQSVISYNNFKLVTAAASNGSAIELWMKKNVTSSRFSAVEISKNTRYAWAISYNNNAAWQSTTPTGAVEITSDWAEPPNAPGNIPLWHAGNDGSGSGLDADLLDGLHASAFALASTVKPTAKSHGAKSANYTLNVNEAEVHTVEFTANATLTIASTLSVDRGLVIVKSNGFTVTIAGVNNNVPTITAAANVQDMLAVVKSFGKITVTAGAFGESAV